MKKDKEWFKGLINEEGIVVDMHLLGRHDEQYWKNENIKINKGRLFYLIDQLDEPEVLSQEWIDDHTFGDWNEYVYTEDLQNILVPKQEKVKIESVWAEDIEGAKASGMTLFETMDWMAIDCDAEEKQDLFARAWLDGYTVEEQKYYAKVKGWGTNGNDGHVYYSGKFPLSLTMPTESVVHTKDEWRNYGVYEGNADFVKVEELERWK